MKASSDFFCNLKKFLFPLSCLLVLAGSLTGAVLLFGLSHDADVLTLPIISNFVHNGSGIAGGDIVGNNVAGKKSLPIYDVCTDEKKVALSFDAAWGADDTIQILDILDKYNVKVTFFMTGGWVDAFPDMVKEIYSRGHDLGNHSQNHKEMSKLGTSEQVTEIETVTAKVKELTGYEMFLFRPPYGDYNSTLINTCYSLNYYPIQWDVDSLDWKDYGVDSIIKTVTGHKSLGNGSIILMHNGAKFTADALESVITNLQNQGYELVPVSQLIIRENFRMDANGTQIAE
jgi:polysaccharide deacetylase family sporulation protein PdaB